MEDRKDEEALRLFYSSADRSDIEFVIYMRNLCTNSLTSLVDIGNLLKDPSDVQSVEEAYRHVYQLADNHLRLTRELDAAVEKRRSLN